MFKNTKKQDLVQVCTELGEVVPTGATIIKLKEIIEKNPVFTSEPDFIKDLICSTIEDRKTQELIEKNKLEEERKLQELKEI